MTLSVLAFSSTNDLGHIARSSVVFFCQFLIRHTFFGVTLANRPHLRAAYFDLRMRIAMYVTPLLAHVAQVVLQRAKEEMGGIYAARVVADVAHRHIIGAFPVVKFIRHTMRATAFVATQLDLPVALSVKRALPLPTIIRAALVNLLPETFRNGTIRGGLMPANILTLPTRKLWWRNFLAAATFAKNGEFKSQLRVARGMIAHVNSPFTTLTTPRDDSSHRRGNFIGLLLDHSSTFGRVAQSGVTV
jgi:hypothetical protein